MKKMLYIMGVEWNWIFQRPHILANLINNDVNLTVVCPRQLFNRGKQNNLKPDRLIELIQIPFQEKNIVLSKIVFCWHKRNIGNVNDYDYIWVGYPLYARYISEDYRGIVIYDCMDNFEALYPDRNFRGLEILLEQEKWLINRADIVFASSAKLREKINTINSRKNVCLLRNGCKEELLRDVGKVTQIKDVEKDRYKLGYIGTISEWFENEVIKSSLEKYNNISYDMIGPVDRHEMIISNRVNYLGVVEHSKLSSIAESMDALIMPFMINDIILYVDPVKLYEYIAWNKCIISSWYPEIDRFSKFVYFYHNKEEYNSIVGNLIKNGFTPKYSQKEKEEFLRNNTWTARYKVVKEKLNL